MHLLCVFGNRHLNRRIFDPTRLHAEHKARRTVQRHEEGACTACTSAMIMHEAYEAEVNGRASLYSDDQRFEQLLHEVQGQALEASA